MDPGARQRKPQSQNSPPIKKQRGLQRPHVTPTLPEEGEHPFGIPGALEGEQHTWGEQGQCQGGATLTPASGLGHSPEMSCSYFPYSFSMISRFGLAIVLLLQNKKLFAVHISYVPCLPIMMLCVQQCA